MDQQELERLAADLQTRLARLEDVEAIKRLKAVYAAASDDDYNADSFIANFVEDSVWDGGELGVYRGRSAIKEWIATLPAGIPWAIHYMMAPHIVVADDGQSATAEWYLFAPLSQSVEGQPDSSTLVFGTYHDELVKVDGEWRFKHVTLNVDRIATLDEGWAGPVPAPAS